MSRNKTIRMMTGGILLAVALTAGITVYDMGKDTIAKKQNTAAQSTDTYTIEKKVLTMPDTKESAQTSQENIAADTPDDKDIQTVQTTGENVKAQTGNEMDKQTTSDTQTKETSAGITPVFNENSEISWPVEGTILLDYSMEETTYFPTLNVYKCNPAILIKAESNEAVHAAYAGKVKEIFTSAETGDTVVVDMGNGYEATYGQLKDITVSKGDSVQKGEQIGKVSEPTRYYRNEGTNLYFGMTKDDQPVDPAMYTETLNE